MRRRRLRRRLRPPPVFVIRSGAMVCIRRARFARDPRDATVARRPSPFEDDDFFFLSRTGNWWGQKEREREARSKNK